MPLGKVGKFIFQACAVEQPPQLLWVFLSKRGVRLDPFRTVIVEHEFRSLSFETLGGLMELGQPSASFRGLANSSKVVRGSLDERFECPRNSSDYGATCPIRSTHRPGGAECACDEKLRESNLKVDSLYWRTSSCTAQDVLTTVRLYKEDFVH